VRRRRPDFIYFTGANNDFFSIDDYRRLPEHEIGSSISRFSPRTSPPVFSPRY
jgi:hypothetical protein